MYDGGKRKVPRGIARLAGKRVVRENTTEKKSTISSEHKIKAATTLSDLRFDIFHRLELAISVQRLHDKQRTASSMWRYTSPGPGCSKAD